MIEDATITTSMRTLTDDELLAVAGGLVRVSVDKGSIVVGALAIGIGALFGSGALIGAGVSEIVGDIHVA